MERAEKQQTKNKEQQQVSFATTLRKVLELEKLVQRDIEALRKEVVGWYGKGK
jgi:glutaredoxin 2